MPRDKLGNAWRLLSLALIAQVGVSVVEQGIPTMAGFIKSDLRLSAAMTGLIVSSLTCGRAVASYAAGVAADRVRERSLLLAGGVLTGVIVAVAAAAVPLPVLVVLMFLAGAATAFVTPAGGRLVLLAFPAHRRAVALGVRQTGIPLGGLIAAVLLPWIAHLASWRWSLAAAGVIAAVAAAPILRAKEPAKDDERVAVPITQAIQWRNVRLLTAWGCLLVSGQYALLAFLALDLEQRADLTLPEASLLLALAQGVGVIGRIGWGAVSDHLLGQRRKPLLVLLTLIAAGATALLASTPDTTPLSVIAVIVVVSGISLIGYQGLWVTMVAEAGGPERAGAATGFAITFIAAAAAVAPPLYGLIADAAGSYHAIWAALTVVLLLALLPAVRLSEDYEKYDERPALEIISD
jgi:predicted MFS family arabinose efflux permease